MMKLVAAALTALAVLGGCDSSNQNTATSTASDNGEVSTTQQVEASIPDQISGSITLREPVVINPGSKLSIQLVDVAQQDLILKETSEDVTTQPPYQFSLPVNPSEIDPTRVYVVNVTLIDGERHYVQALQSPVLTGGAGTTIKVVLNGEATPGEELKDAFSKLKNHIGGMKRIQNSFLDGDLSVAWDGFYEAAGSKLRFMRVNSELGDGDTAIRSNVEYAFLNGKPMMILKKGSGTTRVGWDEDGQVILNEKGNDGPVSDDDAKAFYDDAVKAFAMGEKKLPKKK